jgi:hypothetical protein
MLTRLLRTARGLFTATALVAVAAAPAFAQNITYRFTGFGTGTLNGAAFTNQAFLFEMSTPTAAVNTALFGPATPAVDGLTASFFLGSTGNGTISGVYVFNNQDVSIVGFGTQAKGDLVSLINLPGLATYGMVTNYGPQTATGANLFFSQFINLATSAGALTMTNVSEATFVARVSTNNVVPEPSTYVLMSTGLLAMAGVARRRRVNR